MPKSIARRRDSTVSLFELCVGYWYRNAINGFTVLARRAGNADKPRILTTFNEPIDDWLSFFCFAMFTDRDGKYQLASLAESGFSPLARTTQFMLTEEAHHLFVGETGVERVVQRTAELMAQGTDPRTVGAIPFEILQRYIN